MKRHHATARKVWLIEMWNPARDRYEPTIGAALCRDDARTQIAEWRMRNPDDRFRAILIRYRSGGA